MGQARCPMHRQIHRHWRGMLAGELNTARVQISPSQARTVISILWIWKSVHMIWITDLMNSAWEWEWDLPVR